LEVTTKEAVVIRGTVEVSSGDLPPGILGRSFAGRQLFHVGQTLVLSASEFERLEKLGVVTAAR
jgi:hypothetical protein